MSYFYHSYLYNTATDTLPTGSSPGSLISPSLSLKPMAAAESVSTRHKSSILYILLSWLLLWTVPTFSQSQLIRVLKAKIINTDSLTAQFTYVLYWPRFYYFCVPTLFLQANRTEHSWSCKTVWTVVQLENEPIIPTPVLLRKSSLFQSITWQAKISLL